MSWEKWVEQSHHEYQRSSEGPVRVWPSFGGHRDWKFAPALGHCKTKVLSGRGLVTRTQFSHLKNGPNISIHVQNPSGKKGFEPLGVKQIWVKIPALPLHGWGLAANEILYLL